MISRRAGPIVLFDQAHIVAALFEALRSDIFALVLTSLLPTSDSGELRAAIGLQAIEECFCTAF